MTSSVWANHVARILKTETASLESDGPVSFRVPYLRSYSKGIYWKLQKKKEKEKWVLERWKGVITKVF